MDLGFPRLRSKLGKRGETDMRKYYVFSLITAAVLCSTPVSASAHTSQGAQDIGVLDANITCGHYVETYQSRKGIGFTDFHSAMAYTDGFITALDMENYIRREAQPGKVLGDPDAKMVWLYNYCSAHPLKIFAYAVSALVHHVWHRWPRW